MVVLAPLLLHRLWHSAAGSSGMQTKPACTRSSSFPHPPQPPPLPQWVLQQDHHQRRQGMSAAKRVPMVWFHSTGFAIATTRRASILRAAGVATIIPGAETGSPSGATRPSSNQVGSACVHRVRQGSARDAVTAPSPSPPPVCMHLLLENHAVVLHTACASCSVGTSRPQRLQWSSWQLLVHLFAVLLGRVEQSLGPRQPFSGAWRLWGPPVAGHHMHKLYVHPGTMYPRHAAWPWAQKRGIGRARGSTSHPTRPPVHVQEHTWFSHKGARHLTTHVAEEECAGGSLAVGEDHSTHQGALRWGCTLGCWPRGHLHETEAAGCSSFSATCTARPLHSRLH
jgi:hypothetical protein